MEDLRRARPGMAMRPRLPAAGGEVTMIHETYGWKTFDGVSIFAQEWKAEEGGRAAAAPERGKPKAVVALVHGIGEHSGRYAHVAEAYVKAGYAFSAFDHRGHGKSGGPILYAPSYEHLRRDIDSHLAHTRERFPGIPLVLYGHSMGGSLVLSYLFSRKPVVAAAIASSPGLGSGTPQPPLKILFGRIMSRLAPTLVISTGFPMTGLSHDPEVERKSKADPHCREGISVRLGLEILAAGDWIRAQKSAPVPLLIMQGTVDKFADPEMTISFAKGLSGDVTLKIWEGLYHELHNEIQKEAVIRFMIEWTDGRLSGRD
jgi:alpha-beta hydrolase superfamily lysophospholipase